MKKYLRELRAIWMIAAVSEILAVGMWIGVAESGDPALLTLAVLFTVAPLAYPLLKERV